MTAYPPLDLSGGDAKQSPFDPYAVFREQGGGPEDAATVAACDWLTEADLAVYMQAYGRTGFQGGLNWYRNMTSDTLRAPLRLFSGKAIEVPVAFIGGEKNAPARY